MTRGEGCGVWGVGCDVIKGEGCSSVVGCGVNKVQGMKKVVGEVNGARGMKILITRANSRSTD